MVRRTGSSKLAFTLLELLIAIAIIVILAGLVLVVGARSRAKARAASCMNQMRQIGMALGMSTDRGIPANWPHRVERWSTHEPLLLCPAGPQEGTTNYGVNERLVGRPFQAGDTGVVVLLYESKRAGTLIAGDESDVDQRHLGGCNYVFLDGHARWSKEVPEFGP